MLEWLTKIYRQLYAGGQGENRTWSRWLLDGAQTVAAVARRASRDQLGLRAAMLSYWTALAAVPLLLLAFALTGPLGLTDATRDAVRSLLYETILASSVNEVSVVLDALLDGTSLRALGLAGVAGLMISGSQLYFKVEQAYNDVYGVHVRRTRTLRFLVFYAGITLGPLVLAWGLVTATGLGNPGTFSRLLPPLLTAVGLVGGIRLLPDTHVPWRAALVGGLLSAAVFEGAKSGFGLYMDLFGAGSGVARAFGSLAFLPFSLTWLYLVWFVVLLGVELAYVVQHRSWVLAAVHRAALAGERKQWPDAGFGLLVLTVIAERFMEGRGASGVDDLSGRLAVSPGSIQATLDVLEDAGEVVVSDKGYLLTRPADMTRASDVLAAWRDRASLTPTPTDPAVAALWARLEAMHQGLDVPLSALARGAPLVGSAPERSDQRDPSPAEEGPETEG